MCEATILRRDDDGAVVRHGDAVEEVTEPMSEGELALRPGWPSMFRGYLGEDEPVPGLLRRRLVPHRRPRSARRRRLLWFVGRGDDVIKSAGHLIGPFEVESVLMEHPAVAEAGVIGKPDPVVGQLVKAFVTLRPGQRPEPTSSATRSSAHARRRLGAAVRAEGARLRRLPPEDRSGKIVRRLLRARELGLPEGDVSALEDHP